MQTVIGHHCKTLKQDSDLEFGEKGSPSDEPRHPREQECEKSGETDLKNLVRKIFCEKSGEKNIL